MVRIVLALCFGLLALVPSARAEVVFSSEIGFHVRHAVQSALSPQQAYVAFGQLPRWWGADHTYGGAANALSLTMTPGGCWCERLKNGGFVRHMSVEYAVPGEAVRLSGALGPLAEMGSSGAMTVRFNAREGGGSMIEMNYIVWGAYPGAWAPIAGAVDKVLVEQFVRLAALPARVGR